MEENEAKRREMVKRKKVKRSRGLSFADADEVIDKFGKVAVIKQRVSTKEQVSVDVVLGGSVFDMLVSKPKLIVLVL